VSFDSEQAADAGELRNRDTSMAFRTIHGTAPKCYLLALRLKKARRTLLSNDGVATGPTEVAAHFGFRGLGRFPVAWHPGMTAIPGNPSRRGSPSANTTPVI
jgi:transcriptional regulator GlxA family with amidase domain